MNSTFFIYLVVQIISVFFVVLAYKNKGNYFQHEIINYKIKIDYAYLYLLLSILPLFLLVAFRASTVGADYGTYINLYDAVRTNTLDSRELEWLSPGYRLLNIIFSFVFGKHYIFFFSFIAIVTLYFLYKSIWNESYNPALSLFMVLSFCLYYQLFNQFRQMLAIMLVVYSYKYLKQKNLIKYLIIIILAASFHKSALIMLPMYWITQIKFSSKIIIGYIILGILAYFSIDIMRFLLSGTYYGQMYFGSQYDLIGKTSTYFNLIFRLGLLFSTGWFYKKMITLDSSSNILYHMVFICTIIQVLTVRSYVFGRLTTYFFIFYILLIPNICEMLLPNKYKKIIVSLFVGMLCMYHFVYFNSNNAVESGYREYKFIFQEEAL